MTVAQSGRASACGADCCGFKSRQSPMKTVILIKFGGSAITDKTKEEQINQRNINLLVSQLKKILEKNKNYHFIIGTGAGSFGHIQVNKYNLKNNITSEKQKLGFSIITNLVQTLNQQVIKTFLENNLPAISIKPNSIFLSEKKNYFFIKIIIEALKQDYLPVLYGDMVFDQLKGGRVLSTDEIFYHLVKNLIKEKIKIEKIIFAGDTDGVLDKNGKTIPLITKKTFPKIQSVFTENPLIDVTGGMKKKVNWAIKITQFKIPSFILKYINLYNFLKNKKISYTKVYF